MNRQKWGDLGKIALGLWMTAVLVAAFLYAPSDENLGEAARVIFFHIPVAWVATLSFLLSVVYSIRFLRKRQRKDDRRAVNAAGLGLVYCVLATVTGAIFARITWGAFWNWDPRETSIFFLLLFYGAYFALRAAITDEESRATLSSAYNILGLVVVPFLVFVAPRLSALAGLHPEPLINVRGDLEMGTRTLIVFLASLAGFTGIFFWSFSLVNRISDVEESLLEEL
jgi:heme exporter protein C